VLQLNNLLKIDGLEVVRKFGDGPPPEQKKKQRMVSAEKALRGRSQVICDPTEKLQIKGLISRKLYIIHQSQRC